MAAKNVTVPVIATLKNTVQQVRLINSSKTQGNSQGWFKSQHMEHIRGSSRELVSAGMNFWNVIWRPSQSELMNELDPFNELSAQLFSYSKQFEDAFVV